MSKTILTIFMMLFMTSNIIASETDFDNIKNSMDEKSIPLINIFVELDFQKVFHSVKQNPVQLDLNQLKNENNTF